jgi:ribosomal protein S4E
MIEYLVKVNRKFTIPLSDIICVQKRRNKGYVKYYDKKKKLTLYAIYKGEAESILYAINSARISRGLEPMKLVVEE